YHVRLLCAVDLERHLDRLQELEQGGAQRVLRGLLRAGLRLAQAVDQPCRDVDADVGGEEPLLELLERLLVDAAAKQSAGQPRAAAVQARFELCKKTVALPSVGVGHVRSRFGDKVMRGIADANYTAGFPQWEDRGP